MSYGPGLVTTEIADSGKSYAIVCRPSECLVGCSTRCSIRRLNAEQHLFQQDDVQKFIYRIRRGFLRVYKTFGTGQRRIIELLGPGDFLGLGVKTNLPFSAQAIVATEVCCTSKAMLQSRAMEFAPLTYRLYEALSLELEAARYFAVMVSQHNPQQRLASFLIMLSQRNKQHGMNPNMIYLPMTRSDIADLLGLTIETVSRILTKFKQRGLIEISKIRSIRIIDSATLTEMAELCH